MMRKEKDMKRQERSFANSGLVILCLVLLMVFLDIRAENTADAAQTTGGVNWIDTLGYSKPAFYPINVPDEASCPNKYYVTLSGGSGTTCSQASPCALSGISGKPGTTGGPAYIYIKGNGTLSLTSTLYGSPGSEVVIKPWEGYTTVMSLSGPNNIESSNVHHVIIDGGPNMLFNFLGSTSCGSDGQNSNCAAININSNYITLARSQMQCSIGTAVFVARNSGNVTGTNFINNEFYNCNKNQNNEPLYPGGGNYCSGSATINSTFIKNNIFRDSFGGGVEFNPRTLSDGVNIDGNAFHNIGKGTCGTSWQCRPALIIDGPSCGGTTKNVTISNNLIWDMGSGCIWDRGGSSAAYFYNNTCFDYGKGSGGGGPNPQGISGYTNGGHATVKDNIIYAPNGTAPFDGSAFVKSNNVCSGSGCVTYNSGTLLSTDPNSIGFLKIGANSNATNAGVNLNISTDYRGAPRLNLNGAYDSGAFAYSAEQPAPAPPVLMGVQ